MSLWSQMCAVGDVKVKCLFGYVVLRVVVKKGVFK